MKKGYWIVAYHSISDESAFKRYAELALPAIEDGGGKVIVLADEDVEPREEGLKQRMIVIEFGNFQQALSTYDSPAYKKALQALGSSAQRDFRIVEGFA